MLQGLRPQSGARVYGLRPRTQFSTFVFCSAIEPRLSGAEQKYELKTLQLFAAQIDSLLALLIGYVRYVGPYCQGRRPRCFNRNSGGSVVSVFRSTTDYSGKVSPGSVQSCRSSFPAKGTSRLPNAFDQAAHSAIASSLRHLDSGLRPTMLDVLCESSYGSSRFSWLYPR